MPMALCQNCHNPIVRSENARFWRHLRLLGRTDGAVNSSMVAHGLHVHTGRCRWPCARTATTRSSDRRTLGSGGIYVCSDGLTAPSTVRWWHTDCTCTPADADGPVPELPQPDRQIGERSVLEASTFARTD